MTRLREAMSTVLWLVGAAAASLDFVAAGEPQLLVTAIVNHPGPLSLDGLETVSEEVAEAIRQRRYSTALPDVKVLTCETAATLTVRGGVRSAVWFEGLEKVEAGAVRSLLSQAPPHAADAELPARPAIILPVELKQTLPEEDVRAIESHEAIHFGKPRTILRRSP